MTTLLVEWLGRGGIAQLVPAWQAAAVGAGAPATVVTRGGRELAGEGVVGVPSHRFALRSHHAVAVAAAHEIRRRRPRRVVIQNSIVPALEGRVYDAADAVGAEVVLVVHDHRLHERAAGWRFGFGRLLARAHRVVTHSAFVAEALPVEVDAVVPLPAPPLIAAAPSADPGGTSTDGGLVAVHFGVLHRAYKGGAMVGDIVERAGPSWSFLAVGKGAARGARVATVDRYVDAGELRWILERSMVALLPYTFATQSAAVPLAQRFGVVPVVTAVGGIPEQVGDGADGLLVPAGSPATAWADALARLEHEDERASLAAGGRRRADLLDDAFATAAAELLRS